MIHFALWNLSIGTSRAQKRMSMNFRFFAKCVYMVPSRVETTTAQTWIFMNFLFLQNVCGMVPSRDGTIFRKFEGRGHATDPGLLSCSAQYSYNCSHFWNMFTQVRCIFELPIQIFLTARSNFRLTEFPYICICVQAFRGFVGACVCVCFVYPHPTCAIRYW